MLRFPDIFRRALPSALLAIPLLVAGCGETPTLFDEGGTWVMTHFDIEGTGTTPVSSTQERGFLLRFDDRNDVVAAAGCRDSAESVASPATSLCHREPMATWECHCYAYRFENEEMWWREFDPGQGPPAVPKEDTDDVTLVDVAETEGASAYLFSPLPPGLFGGGESSSFVFQRKANALWENPPPEPDNPQEAPAEACGGCFR